MQHLFDVEVAKVIGVEEAIFLKNMAYWVLLNKANKRNFHENYYWTHNTLDAFTEIFPYWSRRQIERIINNLIKKKVIHKGNFNRNKNDRELWYTITENGAKLLNIDISPNGEMDFTKRGNGFHQTVKCSIANNKPDNKQERETPSRFTLSDFENKAYPFTEEELKLASEQKIVNPALVFEKFQTYLKTKMKKNFTRNDFKLWLLRERPVKNDIVVNREIRCAVPEWGPGHPSYDSVYGSSH